MSWILISFMYSKKSSIINCRTKILVKNTTGPTPPPSRPFLICLCGWGWKFCFYHEGELPYPFLFMERLTVLSGSNQEIIHLILTDVKLIKMLLLRIIESIYKSKTKRLLSSYVYIIDIVCNLIEVLMLHAFINALFFHHRMPRKLHNFLNYVQIWIRYTRERNQ